MNPQEVDQMLMEIIQSMGVEEKMQLLDMLLSQQGSQGSNQDTALAEALAGAQRGV